MWHRDSRGEEGVCRAMEGVVAATINAAASISAAAGTRSDHWEARRRRLAVTHLP